ncbi:hypothetical protein C8R46DRAFT_1040574 [Mycena filopes]|nr:hypothetical protein C8R46DRAFT_1040574 [Mycena filopes]
MGSAKSFWRRCVNKVWRKEKQVPVSWNVALSIVLLAVFIALAATGKLYLPLYTVFIALGVDALLVLNELLYGYVIDARGSRPPVGLLSYHTILGQCWYEAYSMFSDTKLCVAMSVSIRASHCEARTQ